MKNRLSDLLVMTQQHWLLEPAAAPNAPRMTTVISAPVSPAMREPNWRYLAVEAGLLAATAAYFVVGLLHVVLA